MVYTDWRWCGRPFRLYNVADTLQKSPPTSLCLLCCCFLTQQSEHLHKLSCRLFFILCVCSEQIWASSPDRTEQKIAATTAVYAHMYSVTGRSKDYICFNMYCTFTGRMSELLDLQHLECFQKCHMLISSPFFFCSETLRGDCSWCWQHLNANAKCRKCQIMLWLIERAWLWTVWLWLHE